MELQAKINLWRWAFLTYGVLSLSTMAGMGIGGGLFVLATVFFLGTEKKALFTPSWLVYYLWPTFLVLVAAFLSLAAAQIWPPLEEASLGFRELKKFHYFLYPPLVAWAFLKLSDRLECHPFWTAWGGMVLFSGLLAILQFFGTDIFPESWLKGRFFRPVGETGRFHGQGLMFFHLSFASSMCFGVAASGARILWPEKWDSRGRKFFWWSVFVAALAGAFFSYSRIALVAIVAILVILGFLKRPALGLIVSGLCLFLGLIIWWQSPSLRARFEQTQSGNWERRLMWSSALDMAAERPLIGFGFGRSGRYTPHFAEKIIGVKTPFSSHAHNNILDTLAATGLIGLLGYLAWFGSLFYWAWVAFREKPSWVAAAALAAMVGFQINGFTQVNVWDGKSQHSLMIWAGVIIALHYRARGDSKALS